MDETEITIVQSPNRIIARHDSKQIGRITFFERGVLVFLAISATGNSLSSFFIFPKKHFKNHFLSDGSPGCAGTTNSSGCMNAKHFFEFLMFFQFRCFC